MVAASDKQGKASLQLMMLGLVATRMEQDDGPVGDRASCAECIPCFLHRMRKTSCSAEGDQINKAKDTQAVVAALSMRGIFQS